MKQRAEKCAVLPTAMHAFDAAARGGGLVVTYYYYLLLTILLLDELVTTTRGTYAVPDRR